MGVGAAAVIAPALAIVATMYPPEERGWAIGTWSVFGASGLAIGPIVGGVLLAHFWWGSIFLVNVPFVALGVGAGLLVIPQSRKPAAGPLDVVGALLSVAGLGGLLVGIIEGPDRGWLSAPVLVAISAGIVLTVAFVQRELSTPDPLFDVRILARPVVAAGAGALFVTYVVLTGMLFLLPQWLQGVQRESIVTVGLLLVPFAGVCAIGSERSARTVARFGARAVVSGGLALCALGITALAAFQNAPLAASIAASAVVGLGVSGLIAPASTVVMDDLPEAKAGDGSSVNMLSRFVERRGRRRGGGIAALRCLPPPDRTDDRDALTLEGGGLERLAARRARDRGPTAPRDGARTGPRGPRCVQRRRPGRVLRHRRRGRGGRRVGVAGTRFGPPGPLARR